MADIIREIVEAVLGAVGFFIIFAVVGLIFEIIFPSKKKERE